MYRDFATEMRRAFRQTRAGNPAEAARIIRAALSGQPEAGDDAGAPPPDAAGAEAPHGAGGAQAAGGQQRAAYRAGRGGAPIEDAEVLDSIPGRSPGDIPARETLGRVIAGLTMRPPGLGGVMKDFRRPLRPVEIPAGARFESREFTCMAGGRSYRLYVPADLDGGVRGLVLMLHGCTQDPEDFAHGTRMNAQAEAHGLILAYPEQPQAQNLSSCWNWFRPDDQARGRGEPAILAGLVEAVAAEFTVPRGAIFAAGISAGGAMSAILAREYPELFSAIGVHSGIPAGAAHDVVSAFAAMRGETKAPPDRAPGARIVFHGTADRTVHPDNGLALVGGAEGGKSAHVSAGGRRYERMHATSPDGRPRELWLIDGAGHDWAGGSPAGSHTDPSGPDASAEMVRFFLENTGR